MEKWYDHQPEKALESKSVKIHWDMNIQMNKIMEYSRSDILAFEKQTRSCRIVDVVYSFDTRVAEIVEKEEEGGQEPGSEKSIEDDLQMPT